MFAAFAANATNSAAKSAGKQQKKSKSAEKAQAKPRKEQPDYLKVSSKDLTCEQMLELLGFGDHDSHNRLRSHRAECGRSCLRRRVSRR